MPEIFAVFLSWRKSWSKAIFYPLLLCDLLVLLMLCCCWVSSFVLLWSIFVSGNAWRVHSVNEYIWGFSVHIFSVVQLYVVIILFLILSSQFLIFLHTLGLRIALWLLFDLLLIASYPHLFPFDIFGESWGSQFHECTKWSVLSSILCPWGDNEVHDVFFFSWFLICIPWSHVQMENFCLSWQWPATWSQLRPSNAPLNGYNTSLEFSQFRDRVYFAYTYIIYT